MPLSRRSFWPIDDCRAWLPMLALRRAPGAAPSCFLAVGAGSGPASVGTVRPRSTRPGRVRLGTYSSSKIRALRSVSGPSDGNRWLWTSVFEQELWLRAVQFWVRSIKTSYCRLMPDLHLSHGEGRTAGIVMSACSGSCAPLNAGMAGSGLRSISSTEGVWPASRACFFRWNCSPAGRERRALGSRPVHRYCASRFLDQGALA